jgi:hypothetical protein
MNGEPLFLYGRLKKWVDFCIRIKEDGKMV